MDGMVEGPIQGGEVILKSQAHVVGDIHHQSLAIEKGAFFDGWSVQGNVQRLEEPEMKTARQIPKARETLSSRIERAEPVDADFGVTSGRIKSRCAVGGRPHVSRFHALTSAEPQSLPDHLRVISISWRV